jgi:hypothetical protein
MLRHGSYVASCVWCPCRVAHWLSSTMLRACCWLCATRCSPRTKRGSAVCYPLQLACVSTLHASSCMSSAVGCTSSAICWLLHSARCLLVAILCAMSVACCTLRGACCTRSVVCCCVRCHNACCIQSCAACMVSVARCMSSPARCTLSVALVVECPHVVRARCTLFVLCCMSFTVAFCPLHGASRLHGVGCTLHGACYVLHVVRCMAHVCCMSSVACCRVTRRRRPPCASWRRLQFRPQ